MYRVVFSPEAEAQLIALHSHLTAVASPKVAGNYIEIEEIIEQCETLRTFPMRGTLRSDIRPRLRTFGFRRRVTIAFDVDADTVTILGVFYGGQAFEAAFES